MRYKTHVIWKQQVRNKSFCGEKSVCGVISQRCCLYCALVCSDVILFVCVMKRCNRVLKTKQKVTEKPSRVNTPPAMHAEYR